MADMTRFYDLAITVGDAIADALEAEPTSGGRPSRLAYPLIGEIPYDCCNHLSIALNRRFRYTNFPNEINATTAGRAPSCGSELAMDYNVALGRCYTVPDKNGNPPKVTATRAISLTLAVDAEVMETTLYCLMPQLKIERQIGDFQISALQSYAEGGCAGWTAQLTLGL